MIKAPEHDPRNIVDLVERYGDAHISDCGWTEKNGILKAEINYLVLSVLA